MYSFTAMPQIYFSEYETNMCLNNSLLSDVQNDLREGNPDMSLTSLLPHYV